MTTIFILPEKQKQESEILLVQKSSKPYQIRNIAFSRVLLNQRINLRREKGVAIYYLVP
jgi:hypothetical protein